MKLKDWFERRYNSGADQTASERLAIKRLAKNKEFHRKFASALNEYHRNDTNRQPRIINQDSIDLLP